MQPFPSFVPTFLCTLSRNHERSVSHSGKSKMISPKIEVLPSLLKMLVGWEVTGRFETFLPHRMAGQCSGPTQCHGVHQFLSGLKKDGVWQCPLTGTESSQEESSVSPLVLLMGGGCHLSQQGLRCSGRYTGVSRSQSPTLHQALKKLS